MGGALKEFTTRESHCFAQVKDDGSGTLFTSQERQWLVLQVLQGLRAGQSDLEALQGKANVEEGQSIGTTFRFEFINIVTFYASDMREHMEIFFITVLAISVCVASVWIDIPNISIA